MSDRVEDVFSKLAITISFAYSSHIFTALFISFSDLSLFHGIKMYFLHFVRFG